MQKYYRLLTGLHAIRTTQGIFIPTDTIGSVLNVSPTTEGVIGLHGFYLDVKDSHCVYELPLDSEVLKDRLVKLTEEESIEFTNQPTRSFRVKVPVEKIRINNVAWNIDLYQDRVLTTFDKDASKLSIFAYNENDAGGITFDVDTLKEVTEVEEITDDK